MPNFIETNWNQYKIQVFPHDDFRQFLTYIKMGIFAIYFGASYIRLDLRVTVPRKNPPEDIEDNVEYEWMLCDKNCKPLTDYSDGSLRFYKPKGEGRLYISTIKDKGSILKKEGISRDPSGNKTYFYKKPAIDVGRILNHEHYNIVAKFKSGCTGAKSDYLPIAEFSLFERDKFSYAFILSIIGVVTTAIISAILHYYGVL